VSHDLLQVLYGILGGMLPGTVKVAWKFTRGKKVESGTIDLTAYKTRP
jgi:hypothetical protein